MAPFHKAVVTGGCGFIGHQLVNALLESNISVIVIDNARHSQGYQFIRDVQMYGVDVRNVSELNDNIFDADVVFHLAGNANGTYSVLDPKYDFDVNVGGTKSVAEAAIRGGARRFIYVSSAAVYGHPKHIPVSECHDTKPFMPYGFSKLEGERICQRLFQEKQFPVLITRPFCVYGRGENIDISLCEVGRYLRWHCNGEEIQIVGDKVRKARDFVSAEDCVSALMTIARYGKVGDTYNIGTGEGANMLELVKLIEGITGKAAAIKEIPHIVDDTFRLVADISRVKQLGYRPQLSLLDGIKNMLKDPGEMAQLPRTMTIFSLGQCAETFGFVGNDAKKRELVGQNVDRIVARL